jgi:glycosyltransferase involved in cell wall biosynthesis
LSGTIAEAVNGKFMRSGYEPGTPHSVISVAIIIPAYNAADWIAETIESALGQTRPASSIVVIDDGSTDETAKVTDQFTDAVMLISQENSGVSVARNHGARQVTADWLLFLDADDRLRPDAVARLSERAEQGRFGVAYGETKSFGEDAPARQPQPSCEGAPPAAAVANFWKSVPSSPGAVMVRADRFRESGGFDPALSTAADRALWLRLGAMTEWGHVDGIVLERREHADSMARDRTRARIQAAQAQLGFLDWCREHRPELLAAFPSEDEVFHRNLLRAFDERVFDAARWLAEEAGRRGVCNPAVQRAQRYADTPAFLRELELAVRSFFFR